MGTVTVDINGRPYMVGCADGQEDRVRVLARDFDQHVRQVGADVGHVGELRLFLMAALLVSDEIADLRAQVDRMQAEAERGAGAKRTDDEAPARAALALNAAAERIEKLLAE